MTHRSQLMIFPRRRLTGLFWIAIAVFLAYGILEHFSVVTWPLLITLPTFLAVFAAILFAIHRSQTVHRTKEFKFKINREAGNIVEIHVVRLAGQSVNPFKFHRQLKDAFLKAHSFAKSTGANIVRIDSPRLHGVKRLDLLAGRLSPGCVFVVIEPHRMNCFASVLAHRQMAQDDKPERSKPPLSRWRMKSEGFDIRV